ncbi:NAD(P)/FAD-dependent oxidoreductase [Ramlibacter sp.]|uniref:NAD(P)/FAD-dependent oxidoreductase n=1 Tax=Ramlibacter sp. TaxID=1917967 RepID=UPI00260640B8|nr:NAD(P)/FAD-dependent oxidoreductase [Ramlibacter sp.]MDB5957276.1 putative sulfide dehydrogenase [flavocytochrome c] flavoprotein chain precursor [Ramlibacter sp.]
MQRRSLLKGAAASGVLGMAGCATTPAVPARARVVVIGGGYGGATAAKYVRLLSDHRIDVVLIEPNEVFISCPLSNLVLGGSRQLAELTVPYSGLARPHGVTLVKDFAQAVDPQRRTVTLAGGAVIGYEKLVLSPGVDLMFDSIEGLRAAHDSGRVLQAWKAGPETLALRRQLEAMPDGGVYALTIPEQPYRCPPGPYERACQVAWYFKQAKPRSKVLVLDANPDIVSKGALFRRAWSEQYPGMIEYRPQHKALSVDAQAGVVKFEVQEDVKADVLNVLPPMRAGAIAVQAGLNNMAGQRWCGVDYLSFASTVHPDIHVIGDAMQAAPAMPKSGHMANAHAKVAAAAIVAELSGWPVDPAPVLTNTCYSFVDDQRVMHVASVHAWSAALKTYIAVPNSGGLSAAASEQEGRYALNWAHNIWADALS